MHMMNSARSEGAHTIIYTGLLGDIGFVEVTPQNLPLDPYIEKANIPIRKYQDLNNYVSSDYEEVSPVESDVVNSVMQFFLFKILEQRIATKFRIFSRYHSKCHLTSTMFENTYIEMMNATNAGLSMLRSYIFIVSSFQRLDHEIIIFTAGRGTFDPRTVGQDSILDIPRNLFAILAMDRLNVIIIVSMNYIHDFSPSWAAVVHHFRRRSTWLLAYKFIFWTFKTSHARHYIHDEWQFYYWYIALTCKDQCWEWLDSS